MKIKAFLLTLLFVFMSVATIHAQKTDGVVVSYIDSIPLKCSRANKSTNVNNAICPYKMVEDTIIKSRKGYFVASCELNRYVTDGVLYCLKLSMDAWEEKLNLETPVYFRLLFSDKMDNNIAASTSVSYYIINRQAIPDNLIAQYRKDVNPADTLTLNSSIDWYSSWEYMESANGKVSLMTYLNRNIARILGFGCSLVKRKYGLGFAINRTPSAFDKLLYNGENYLDELSRASSNILNGFFKKDVRVKSDTFEYDLYDTGHFINGQSGSYFSLGFDNILEYQISDESVVLPINYQTLDVLEKLGWRVNKHDKEIICDATNNLGYGSIYDAFSFVLKDAATGNSLKADWKYQVFDTFSSTYKTLSTNSGNTFSVAPSIVDSSVDDYKRMQARVVAAVSGIEYYYPLTFDISPQITDVKISNVEKTDNIHYQFDIDIKQKGATEGYVLAYDDTGSTHNYKFTGKTVHVSGLIAGMSAYIYISLSNKYGSSTYSFTGDIYGDKNHVLRVLPSKVQPKAAETVSLSGRLLRNGEILTMGVESNNYEVVDSVKWYLYEGEYCKHLATKHGNDKTFDFQVSPNVLDFRLSKKADDNICYVTFGNSWKRQSYVPNEQYFDAVIYCHDINGQFVRHCKFTDFTFDVLPTEPKISIIETWNDTENDVSMIYARLKIDTNRANTYIVYVHQYDAPAYDYGAVVVSPDDYSDECEAYVGDMGNSVYCMAINDYGNHTGKKYEVSSTEVSVAKDVHPCVIVSNNILKITNDNLFDASVFALDGRLIWKCSDVFEATKELAKGCYILKIFDRRQKSVMSKKIILH